jgi:hypothetical protein
MRSSKGKGGISSGLWGRGLATEVACDLGGRGQSRLGLESEFQSLSHSPSSGEVPQKAEMVQERQIVHDGLGSCTVPQSCSAVI